ncbi:MAG: rRNA maturation RNase YbeY [Deltaproteobacteria bacterium]|nr:rRNA maturation RNase YbeY [Deltaproteobacteria bacterium]
MACEVMPAGDAVPSGVDLVALAGFADRCAAVLGREGSDWSIVLGDDPFLFHLNTEYRSMASATDVLSFPQTEFADGPNQGEAPELGDVVVSVETAARQAAEHGHGLQAELEILVVHGLCHLLGWDHETPDDAQAMRASEARVLHAAGGPAIGLVRRAGA